MVGVMMSKSGWGRGHVDTKHLPSIHEGHAAPDGPATTLRNMSGARIEDEAASDGQPVAQAAAQAAVDRLGAPPARQGPRGSKKRDREDEPNRKKAEPQHAAFARVNKLKFDTISRRFNYRVTIRAPPGATPLDLLEQAKQAARLPDLLARVTSVNGGGGERAVPQWDELRVWDPGD